MPAEGRLMSGREGHIDLVNDIVEAEVAMSLEGRKDEQDVTYVILHLDVATGPVIEEPFSVGINLSLHDIARLAQITAQIVRMDRPNTPGSAGRLN